MDIIQVRKAHMDSDHGYLDTVIEALGGRSKDLKWDVEGKWADNNIDLAWRNRWRYPSRLAPAMSGPGAGTGGEVFVGVTSSEGNGTWSRVMAVLNRMRPESPVECPFDFHDVNFSEKLGYGLFDTGCGRFVAGSANLDPHIEMLEQRGISVKREKAHQVFRFGNGQTLTSTERILLPVGLGGRNALARVFRVEGPGPILISNRIIEAIGETIKIKALKWEIVTGENVGLVRAPSGHWLVDLTEFHPEGFEYHGENDILLDTPDIALLKNPGESESDANVMKDVVNPKSKYNALVEYLEEGAQ